MKPVEKPNLPGKAETVMIGQKYYQLLEKTLEKLGIKALSVPDNGLVDPRLAGHADLSVLHLGGDKLWLAPHLEDSTFAKRLADLGCRLDFAPIKQSAVYPGDAQLNICICGKYAFCNRNVAPKRIVDDLISRGFQLLDCRQGYSKCSICVVDEEAIITADRGVEAVARRAGLDTLWIEPGCIVLEGFPYGFIGGSSFKISDGKLAFTGTLNGHKSKYKILSFLKSHHVEPVFLTERPIFDIGSGLPLTET